MTLYEMNKIGYSSLPRMSKSEIATMKERVTKWISEQDLNSPNSDIFFILLNNDLHYYTIFAWEAHGGSCGDVTEEIFSIVKDLGTLKSIEFNDNGAWEFWITGKDAVSNMYLLFNYTEGVIKV